ncbi:diguanylate cyclase GGDEF domain protein [Asticcacaulis biprosthecium C19]|uniref:Diguanylate cyclase GGDEF domain protein n=1 Tax=Asticcacaulis biprosthecium C19 TaxID=715226 RepID=F4QIK8_9CAUL|nr:EAL domain-containing protein [Asticcacaulis biprosthecium]EGF92997.1 diguanylate cyclase GGDEF domain protein [Asticcacaulis biprosthecium C19]
MKTFIGRLRHIFTVSGESPELVQAQFRAFCKQMPTLYFILTVSTLAVSYTFSSRAPLWLSVYLPGAICLVCVGRFLWWIRAGKKPVSHDHALHHLKRTNTLAALLSIGLTTWGLSLYGFGDAEAQGHVIFYMALTVIACIFCLMHLRSAAISVTLIVVAPYIVFLMAEGGPTQRAIAVNLLLVCMAMISVLLTHDRDFKELISSRRDLTAKQAETEALSNENFRIANLDALTGLPNRRRFFHDAEAVFAAAEAGGKALAIGVIDLDGFKPVNDTFGHAAGDRVLVEAAERFQRAAAETGHPEVMVYRLGGDEFGLVVQGELRTGVLEDLGRRLTEATSRPFAAGGAHTQLACSIGFALWPQSGTTAESLFECADYALYHAKRHLRGQTVLFSTDHQAEILNQSVVERSLQAADLSAELSLVYQPLIDLRTGRTVGFEALARWDNPSLGRVTPAVFIPAAERAGLIGTVTRVLLEKALREARTWPPAMGLSFNLSAHDICAAEGVVRLIAIVHASGIDPKRIDFEITETAMTADFERACQSVNTLKALGCQVSLDDFGTGYSSLSHVHRLPLDRIKVDRSFVADLDTNPASRKIVKSLTSLCLDFGLTSVIEGVETAQQLEVLAGLNGDLAQGFLFACPMPAAEIPAYLAGSAQAVARMV